MDTGNIYRDNTNLEESIYDFLLAQQNEAKKPLDYEFNSYLNETINPIIDDRGDLHTHSASKFLYYHFNNLIQDLNEDTCKIRHTLISDDKYTLGVLQSKNWSYFIKTMLEVSQGDISLLNMCGVSSDNLGGDIKIINDTKDNLTICKDTHSYFYSNIDCVLQRFLQVMHEKHIEKMGKDLAQNHYFIDLRNEQNEEDIMIVFAEFFFTFGRFLGTIDHLLIVPTVETPSFVKESKIISTSWLY